MSEDTTYVIDGPSTLRQTSAPTLFLEDTTLPKLWTTGLNSSGNYRLSSSDLSNILVIDSVTGAVNAASTISATKALLRDGANTVTVQPTVGSATYSVNYPAVAPAQNTSILYNTGGTSTFRNLYEAQNYLVVRKDPLPGEYSTIVSALAAVSGASDTNRFVITVYPGLYEEAALVLPEYTFIVGTSMQGVTVAPSGGGYDLFTLTLNSGLAFLTILNVASPNYGIHFDDVGDYALIHKVEIEGCDLAINCSTSSQESLVYLEYVGITGTPGCAWSLRITDDGVNANYVSAENFFITEGGLIGVLVDGDLSYFNSEGAFIEGLGTGTGIEVTNSSSTVLRGVYFDLWDTAVLAPASGAAPEILLSGLLFQNCTMNIDIQNTTCTGNFYGYSEYAKTFITPSSSFFIAQKDRYIITVAQKGADYTSVKDAIDGITGNNASNRFVVYVGPGIYEEDPITMKEYVNIVGFLNTQTVIKAKPPVSINSTLITAIAYSSVRNITLESDYTVSGTTLVKYIGDATGRHFRMDSVIFNNAKTLVDMTNTGGDESAMMVFNPLINTTTIFDTGFKIVNTSTLLAKLIMVFIDGLVWAPNPLDMVDRSLLKLFQISSAASDPNYNIIAILSDVTAGHNAEILAAGKFLSIEGGACIVGLDSTTLAGFEYGTIIENAGIANISLTSNVFRDNVNDISITTETIGSISSIVNMSKIAIDPSCTNLGVNAIDPSSGSIFMNGQIFQGTEVAEITNITEQIQHGSCIGVIGDFTISDAGGLTVDVPAGAGYLMVGASPTDYLKYVEWNASLGLALTLSTINWIYVNNSAVVSVSLSQPSHITNIILGAVKTNATTISYIQHIERVMNHVGTQSDNTLREAFGPIAGSGFLATAGSATREVDVTGGNYFYGTEEFTLSAGTDITFFPYCGGVEQASATTVPLDWDDSGTPTALLTGEWAKHSLYVVGTGGLNKVYLLVIGQEIFASELLAQQGDLPLPPITFVANVMPISAIVVSGDDGAVLTDDRFIDIRPTISFRSGGTTLSSDHNALTNLAVGDVHTQYLPIDGTRGMTGTLELNNNIITEVTSLQLLNTGTTTISRAAGAGTLTFVLPNVNGSSGNVLSTNGSGTLSWTSVPSTSSLTTNAIVTASSASAIQTPSATTTLNGSGLLSGVETFQSGSGSAGTPTYSFSSSTGTGGYLEAANVFGISTNAARSVTVSGGSSGVMNIYNGATNFSSLSSGAGSTGITFVLPATTGASTQLLIGGSPTGWITYDSTAVAAATIVQRTAGGQANLRSVGLSNGTNTIVLSPGTPGSNFTITLPTNTGSSNQALTTNGSGVTSWTSIILDTMTTAGDMIYRNTSNVTSRLPYGLSATYSPIYPNIALRNEPISATAIQSWLPAFFPKRQMMLFDDFRGNSTPFGDLTIWTRLDIGTGSSTAKTTSASLTTYPYSGAVTITSGNGGVNARYTSLQLINNAANKNFLFYENLSAVNANPIMMECRFCYIAIDSNHLFCMGLTDTITIPSATTVGVTMEYISSSPTTLTCRYIAGGTTTTTSITISALTTNTWYTMQFKWNRAANLINYYFNANPSSTASINTTGLPAPAANTGLDPYVITLCTTAGAAAQSVSIDYIWVDSILER